MPETFPNISIPVLLMLAFIVFIHSSEIFLRPDIIIIFFFWNLDILDILLRTFRLYFTLLLLLTSLISLWLQKRGNIASLLPGGDRIPSPSFVPCWYPRRAEGPHHCWEEAKVPVLHQTCPDTSEQEVQEWLIIAAPLSSRVATAVAWPQYLWTLGEAWILQ